MNKRAREQKGVPHLSDPGPGNKGSEARCGINKAAQAVAGPDSNCSINTGPASRAQGMPP
jgi:hypothetical protein